MDGHITYGTEWPSLPESAQADSVQRMVSRRINDMKTISKTPRCDMLEEISEPVSVSGSDAINLARSLEEEILELRQQYKRMHSQVSGYLHGEEWEHWQKYNEPQYAPAEAANTESSNEA